MTVYRDTTGPLVDQAERRLAELRGERQEAERRYALACTSLEKRVAQPAPPAPRAPAPPPQRPLSARRILGWAVVSAFFTLIAMFV